ncbi:hypothetical protein EPN95_01945 [Patescibacteria group bacterium]|nr:MAG: hypothetical protein EPN95_01945 [Patescibacteria group bacterium]
MFIKLRQFITSRYGIPVIVFTTYLLLNHGITGPAYLSDEIGYLDKAATIAGSLVHLSTSWFGGYSLMISPAFMLSANIHIEWLMVLILNALMWAGSAALLQYMLRTIYPKTEPRTIWFVTIGTMAYPSWLSMSGYAFSTSGFVLVFLAALATLLKSKLTNRGWLIIAGLLSGYLCWIHPLGFLLVGLLGLLFIFQSVLRKKLIYSIVAVLGALIGISYLLVIEPIFEHIMSGSITNDVHYTNTLTTLLSAATGIHFWLQAGLLLLGLLLFVIVATFGTALYGATTIISQLFKHKDQWKAQLLDVNFVIKILSVLLVILVLFSTALSFAASGQLRIDQWVYGRYTDMYLLPLIAFGLLATWRFKQALIAAGAVIITGIILSLATNAQNTSFVYDNKVNIQGLWPMFVASVFHVDYYWLWAILGGIGIAIVGLMGTKKYKPFLLLLFIPITLADVGNYLYHHTVINQHSTVSSLYQDIKNSYKETDCIGFTPVPDSNERFNLYSYYLHGYDIRQISFAQWLRDNCSGPYLTYTLPPSLPDGVQVTGQEVSTKLLLISHVGTGSATVTPTLFR